MRGSSILGALLLTTGLLGALLGLGCDGGYHPGFGRAAYYGGVPVARSVASSTTASGFVTGGGTITTSTTIGGYPVSGTYVGPDGIGTYSGSAPYGYGGYGYGTYTRCTGAVACGADVSVSTERVGVGRSRR
jgi:hypothetical protein